MRKDIISPIIITAIFIISRVILFSQGVHFDTEPLFTYSHYIDVELLKNEPFVSLFYLHCQPPLFNAFLALIINSFPQNYPFVFQSTYLLMGLVLCLSLYSLMLATSVNRHVSFILTALFAIHPSIILYENWFFYSYPMAVLLVLSACALSRYLRTKKTRDAFVFFCLMAALSLTQVTFHLTWLVLVSLIFAWKVKPRRKEFVKAALIPIIIVLSVYVKNYVTIGEFTLSSLSGFQLAKMTMMELPYETIRTYEEQKKIAPYTYREVADHRLVGQWAHQNVLIPQTGIKLLDQYRKSSGGLNYNSLHVLYASKQYQKDAQFMFKEHPEAYLRTVRKAFWLYLFPGPTDMYFKNRTIIKNYESWFNFMFHRLDVMNGGQLYSEKLWLPQGIHTIRWDFISLWLYVLVVAGFIATVGYGFWRSRRCFDPKGSHPNDLVVLYMTVTIVYVTLTVNLFGDFGNNRYRFVIDPFYTVLLGLIISCVISKIMTFVNEKSKK